jgi:putative tricarboxylic transport membrane protein
VRRRALLAGGLAAAPCAGAWAVTHCVVPAKAGGGFDATCQLLSGLLASHGSASAPRIVFQPGGIGALTYSEVVRGGRPHPRELVAFSTGTLLNIAQGRFGPWRPDRIRWVAALALDHGVVAVHRDAPWRTLADFLEAVRRQPAAVAFASGGTIGSQDWMKAALLARSAGVSHRALRVVAFEGGGDAVRALEGRHVQALCGDAGELSAQLARGAPLRALAVLSDTRLRGTLAAVPTAAEQGVPVRWPILRGLYASADFPEAELAATVNSLALALRQPAFEAEVLARGMTPLSLTGEPLRQEVEAQLARLRTEAERMGLVKA